MIQFDHVSKQYGSAVTALNDVTFSVQDGEFVFLIGPTGAGKSTLFRLLIRDMLPTSGSIIVDDVDIITIPQSKLFAYRRSIGMVFQDFKLLTDRTVKENVAIGLEILEKNPDEVDKGVKDVLELVHLEEKADSFPAQLSAGELQRIAIARAIVGGPKMLLADEPTGNLDPETAQEILELLEEIHSMGTTVIVVTHNATFVDKWKKRTITLNKGTLVSDELKGKYHLHKHEKSKHTIVSSKEEKETHEEN